MNLKRSLVSSLTPKQSGTTPAQPADSAKPSTSGVKRPRLQLPSEETGTENKKSKTKWEDKVGTMRPVEPYGERTIEHMWRRR